MDSLLLELEYHIELFGYYILEILYSDCHHIIYAIGLITVVRTVCNTFYRAFSHLLKSHILNRRSRSTVEVVNRNESSYKDQIEALQQLRCDWCTSYLNSTPIMIGSKGTNLCGHCYIKNDVYFKEKFHPNIPYESTAKNLTFPCYYQELGCKEKVHFDDNHECDCPFKPVTNLFEMKCWECDWCDRMIRFEEHFSEAHGQLFATNPFFGKPNIESENTSNFLLKAFGFLFKLQVKYSSGTVNHDVTFLGPPTLQPLFRFSLVFSRGSAQISETRQVRPRDGVDECTVNTLRSLTLLGDYNDIDVQLSLLMEEARCVKCTVKLNEAPIFTVERLYFCRRCFKRQKIRASFKRVYCRFSKKGCDFKSEDITSLTKHETWFCPFKIYRCRFCWLSITGNLFQHEVTRHSTVLSVLNKDIIFDTTKREQIYSFTCRGIKFLCRMSLRSDVCHIQLMCDTKHHGRFYFLWRYTAVCNNKELYNKTLFPVLSNFVCDWSDELIVKPGGVVQLILQPTYVEQGRINQDEYEKMTAIRRLLFTCSRPGARQAIARLALK